MKTTIALLLVIFGALRLASGFVVLPSYQGRLPGSDNRLRPLLKTDLSVVIDAGENIGRRRRNSSGDDNIRNNHEQGDDDLQDDSWIPTSSGGFLPNLSRRVRRIVNPSTRTQEVERERIRLQYQSSRQSALDYARRGYFEEPSVAVEASSTPPRIPTIQKVLSIDEYKKVVVEEKNVMVVVRFYAPWCRACKAISNRFRQQLPAKFGTSMKFVEVPLTKENAFLHEGLGVPSLPFAHVYHPDVGLVEERKINQKMFSEFVDVLQTYHQGYCVIQKDEQMEASE
jgi:thiol-disulfide isomerase/thioredoxin